MKRLKRRSSQKGLSSAMASWMTTSAPSTFTDLMLNSGFS
ncbi:Uncharacterised protein [Mycobacterium tuberculosis]|nr:Uncharacterised protein [Mycobacterium tuberculosis]